MNQQHLFESSLKTIGLLSMDEANSAIAHDEKYKPYIKILLLPAQCRVKVDFEEYTTEEPALFFVAPNQYLKIEKAGSGEGFLIFYNRDFYCIQLHDKEVACDGILFNNVKNMPHVKIGQEESNFARYLLTQMKDEFELKDSSLEEMIRTYLKQLLIKATRLWKKQHLDHTAIQQNDDLEFFRKFTMLVDAEYKTRHTVADYADLLFLSPKTITHKFKRLNLPQPNEVIKNRIVLEAKRLLIHTSMTAKEIAYHLGYEDPAYFSRLFLVKTGESPSGFRAKYNRQN